MSVEKIKEAFAKYGDFQLELEVARSLSDQGFEFVHGGGYLDMVTGKFRQFDFQLGFSRTHCELLLAIECKNIAIERPLVGLGYKTDHSRSRHLLVGFESDLYSDLRAGGRESVSFVLRSNNEASWLPVDDFVAKSLVFVKIQDKSVQNDGDIFERYNQALSSGKALLKQCVEFRSKTEILRKDVGLIPIVVLPDNVLFRAEYEHAASGPSISQVDSLVLNIDDELRCEVDQGPLRYITRELYFFTTTGFRRFLSNLRQS